MLYRYLVTLEQRFGESVHVSITSGLEHMYTYIMVMQTI